MREIRLGYNAVPSACDDAILKVFRSGRYSPGKKVKEFEQAWATAHESKHAVFVNSGTDALRLSLLAMKEKYGWPDESEVAVPAITFVATVNTILQANLRPFFVDVGMHDYIMNPWNLEHRIQTSKTRLVAMVPVHMFGQAPDAELYKMGAKYKLKVLEDSCETILNKPMGDVSCHSTYMAHHVTTGVGGMAVTDDPHLNWLIRSFANHGRDPLYIPGDHGLVQAKGIDLLKRRFSFDRMGYSCRGTEFEAALGLSQMKFLSDTVLKRQLVASLLVGALKGHEDLTMPTAQGAHTWMMFPIVLHEHSKIDKYKLCDHLEKSGIETRDMMPITNQPCFRHLVHEDDFPVAKWINEKGFYIACNPAMTSRDVKHIQKTFSEYLKK